MYYLLNAGWHNFPQFKLQNRGKTNLLRIKVKIFFYKWWILKTQVWIYRILCLKFNIKVGLVQIQIDIYSVTTDSSRERTSGRCSHRQPDWHMQESPVTATTDELNLYSNRPVHHPSFCWTSAASPCCACKEIDACSGQRWLAHPSLFHCVYELIHQSEFNIWS